ncbi:MAG: hypothetical protein ACHQZS_03770 [Candidatus Binatales bacterium]
MRSTALTRLSGECETIRVVLALAILFAGVPVVIAAPTPNSGPVITIDICHPLQAPVGGSAPSLTPTLAAHRFTASLADRGDAPDAIVASRAPLREAPDPPPPERAS